MLPDSLTEQESEPSEPRDYLELLSAVAVIANLAQDTESALAMATQQICLHTGWEIGHAYAIDSDGDLESTGVWHDETDLDLCIFGDYTITADFSHGQGLPGRVVVSGRPALIPDIETDTNFSRREVALISGLVSAFAFPVLAGPDVVAVLEFFSTEPSSPQPGLMEVMAQVGVQLGRVFEREVAEDELRSSEQRALQILNSAADAYVAMDASGRITEWNQAAENVFGWNRAEVIGLTVAQVIVPPDMREAHNRGIERFLLTQQATVLGQTLELRSCHRSGHEFPIEITMWSLQSDDEWTFYAFIRDITQRKRAERELEYESMHDDLTGLPNRTLLLGRLGEALGRVRQGGTAQGGSGQATRLAVFFVDIDRFKLINDSLGHDVGDEVLIKVANRLLGTVRPTDIVARLGSDEFVIACEYTGEFDPAATARRLHEALAEPVRSGGDSIYVSVSIGIALADTTNRHDAETHNIIAAASAAMNNAKSRGRGNSEIFDEPMRDRMSNRFHMEGDLRRALTRREFTLHYQPLLSLHTGQASGAEALIRWNHPERGFLPPFDFIPIAEETGLIVPLGTWVIEEACRQALRWSTEARTGPPLKLAVNLSARQLAQSDLVSNVRAILEKAQLNPEAVQICFEVTESLLMVDPDAAERTLNEIRALGVTLAIDDFGTGYSSLSYLKRFPVQIVKIDRSFVTTINDDPADRAIVESIIDLAHALGMSVVAEGVETVEQLECLKDIGADVIQGYLFSKPKAPDEIHHIMFSDATEHSPIIRACAT
ncbi:MAG: EAL domain-containing protein [Microthrixaceae bacterium]